MLSRTGLDQPFMREIAASLSRRAAGDLSGLLHHALFVTALVAAIVSVGVLALGQIAFREWVGAALLPTMAIAIMPLALLSISANYMKGRRLASAGVLMETGGLSLGAAGLLWAMALGGRTVTLPSVVGAFVATAILAALVAVACRPPPDDTRGDRPTLARQPRASVGWPPRLPDNHACNVFDTSGIIHRRRPVP